MRSNAYSAPLQPAVKGGVKELSEEGRKRIRELNSPQPVRFFWEIVKTWIVIISAIAIAVHAGNIFVSALAIFVVATRQNVLGLLMHEQTHYLGFKHKYGDLITDLLVCYPLIFVSVENYSKVHLAHHKHYFTDKDPDLARKSGRDWIFPMEHRHLLKLFVQDLFGINLLETLRGKNLKEVDIQIKRLWKVPKFVKPLYLVVAAFIITITHSWGVVLLYWVLPFVTVLQVFVRWGAIREHFYIHEAPLEVSTPLIINPWWERLIMPDQNFGYHIYHHYFAAVPFSNLPKVHKIFVEEGLVDQSQIFHGSWPYLKALLRRPAP